MLPIGIDVNFWENLHYNNIFILALELLLAGGWLFIFWQFRKQVKEVWLNWRQGIFSADNPFVLMEISVPSKSLRNIEAIEQIFAQIHALRRSPTWWETWWKGQYVLKVVFEIVSFAGQIKFYISSTYKHQHLIEAALQAQYPEAQIRVIKEEDDYKHIFPNKISDPEFEMLGSEYVFAKRCYYPLKSYQEYEKTSSGEYLDPLRHLFELMSNLKEGEYLWYQITCVPEYETWALQQRKAVDKLLGKAVAEYPESKKSVLVMIGEQLFSLLRSILLAPVSLVRELCRQLFVGTGGIIWSQVKDDTYQEAGRQLKGIGREFKDQVFCLHEAFLSQFRKKKPSPTKEELPVVNIENQISVNPNIEVNVSGTEFPSDYIFRSQKQKAVIDAIERKLSKHIYKTCIRTLYFAKKPVYSKFRFWSEVHGVFKHFSDIDYNVLVRGTYTKTACDYFFAKIRKKMRQNAIIKNAKARDWYAGDEWNYLSTEELATLWHLPHKEDLLANIQLAKEPIKPPPASERVRPGYNKEKLLDFDAGAVPDNLPVTEFEPYNYS